MTYESVEISNESGKPFYLYEITTPIQTYRYTSLNFSHDVNSQTWIPQEITHSVIKQSTEISKNKVNINMPIDSEFASLFKGLSLEYIISVSIFRGHYGQSNTELFWKGYITNLSKKDKIISFSIESIFAKIKRYGIRQRYTKNCRHTLYGRGCNLDINSFEYTSYFAGIIDSFNFYCPTDEVDGFFSGGIVKFSDGSDKYIKRHFNGIITINSKSSYIESILPTIAGYGVNYGNNYGSISLFLYPGCDKTLQTCIDKFQNEDNNGGFKWIPDLNPLSGRSVV